MWRDPILEEIDLIRQTLLAECANDLDRLMDRMAEEGAGRHGRVESVEELNQRFPITPEDAQAVAALGEIWRDPIVEEVQRVRKIIARESGNGTASTTPLKSI